jgi:hypothetical protein
VFGAYTRRQQINNTQLTPQLQIAYCQDVP